MVTSQFCLLDKWFHLAIQYSNYLQYDDHSSVTVYIDGNVIFLTSTQNVFIFGSRIGQISSAVLGNVAGDFYTQPIMKISNFMISPARFPLNITIDCPTGQLLDPISKSCIGPSPPSSLARNFSSVHQWTYLCGNG